MTHPALTLARKKQNNGQLTDALMVLSDAIKDSPHERSLLHARAHLFISLQQFDQGADDLDAIIANDPGDSEALDDRGVLYQWQGNFLKAAEHHMQAVDLAPSDGVILNLAIALNQLGQRNEAEKLYEVVLQINPASTRALVNLAILNDERGNYDKAEKLLKESIKQGDKSFELAMAYGNVCRKQERKEDALKWYQLALRERPKNSPAAFLVALMKGENPEAPPQEHVADLFDSYADSFESSLVGQLKYRTPDLLFNASKKELDALKEKHTARIGIDLGAGTGLFGKILRPYLTQSIGLDLSIKMLQKAQDQNIYDSILCLDMVEGLEKYPPKHFHVVSAADVLVYVGKLDALFKAIHKSLAPGGLYIFSTEAINPDEKGDYIARDTGRYAHSEEYLKRLTTENGFETISFEKTWIRYNKDKPLDGFVVILKKSD